jgi:hypothetical protein
MEDFNDWRSQPTAAAPGLEDIFEPRPFPPPARASSSKPDAQLYEPTESDFSGGYADQDLTDYEHYLPPTPLPAALDLPVYADADTKDVTKRRRRKAAMLDLPPLPAGEMPEDGRMRYDWRKRALSRGKRVEGARWFPKEERRRVPAEMSKLSSAQMFFEVVERYFAQSVYFFSVFAPHPGRLLMFTASSRC